MPLKGPEKKKYNDAYYKRKKEEKEYLEHNTTLENILHGEDGSGDRFKSESLSMTQLTSLYNVFSQDLGTFEDFLGLRDRARKDLFWLGAQLDWQWFPHVHQATCDFFVQKNFDGVYHEGYTIKEVHNAIERQDDCHHRLLLDPRYHYKTTIDSVDSLQWMINVPDIRLFILTAEEENADDFVGQIKGYLYHPKGHELTRFQKMFPEYVLRGKEGSSKQSFVSPARQHNQKDPTFWADSIMATLSGLHCDVMKADDVISNRNSDTEDARRKLKRKFDQAIHLLDPWGFFDVLGTRYSSDDWYAYRLKAAEEIRESGIENTLKIQVRSGWTVKDGVTEEGIAWKDLPLKKLKLEMVDLLFPELKSTPKKTFEHFMVDVYNNELDFRCQILNEPAHDEDKPYVNPFSDGLLTGSTTHGANGPTRDQGDLYIWWDTALTDGKNSDFCVGVAAQIWQRPDQQWELFIWEVYAHKLTTFDLARSIVAFSKKWNPLIAQFEQPRNLEVKDLMSAINKQKMLQDFYGPIVPVPPDPKKDAKINRIKGLEVLFRLGLIRFAFGPWLDLTFEQFKKFTGITKNRGRKDDIPDAIASIAKRMPYIGVTPNPEGVKSMEEQKAREEQDQRDRMYARYFGTGPGPTLHNPQPVEDENFRGTHGIPFGPKY